MKQSYKIKFTHSSRNDMRQMKKYILTNFKYRELVENFSKKMKEATKQLKIVPKGFDKVGMKYGGYDIYLKPYRTYLFFYIVDELTRTVTVIRVMHDGMDWKWILNMWLHYSKTV